MNVRTGAHILFPLVMADRSGIDMHGLKVIYYSIRAFFVASDTVKRMSGGQ